MWKPLYRISFRPDCVLFLALALLFSGQVMAAEQAVDEPIAPARKQELRHLLKQDCGSCHGLTLEGGLGPALLPENIAGKSSEWLRQAILDGIPGTAMPPWRPFMNETEADWLVQIMQQGAFDE